MLDEMRAFATLAEVGSVQHTAHRLHRTQSAITRQLQRLESELGVTLLDRRVKPATLTSAGQTVLERCRTILRSVEELRASAAIGTEPAGSLRIGIGNALADDDVADRISTLGLKFRRLSIHVTTDWTPQLIEQLTQGRLDFAILPKRQGVTVPGELHSRLLGREPLVFVASRDRDVPAHPSLSTLAPLPWVLKPKGCGTRETLRLLMAGEGLAHEIAAEVRDEHLQLSLIAGGLGVGLVAQRSLTRHPRLRELRALQVPGVAPILEITALRGPHLGSLTAAVDALEEELAQRFGGPAP